MTPVEPPQQPTELRLSNVPNLFSTDVNIEEGRYCPLCGTDWRASQIPPEQVARDYYGHRAPCLRQWGGDIECTCEPRYFSRLIGVETLGHDRVGKWQCPDCLQQWDRDTREPIMRDGGNK